MKYRLKAASGRLTGQTFELGEATRIGSSTDADIRIEGAEPEMARIVARDGGLVLEAHAEVRVNGEVIENAGARALESGMELQFGTVRFVLQAPGLKPARVLDRVPQQPGRNWRAAVIVGLAAGAGALTLWWWFFYAAAGR